MKSIGCTTTYARLNQISIEVLLSEDKCFMLRDTGLAADYQAKQADQDDHNFLYGLRATSFDSLIISKNGSPSFDLCVTDHYTLDNHPPHIYQALERPTEFSSECLSYCHLGTF